MPRIVRVAVPVPLPRLFDYVLVPHMDPPLVGSRVRVPFAQGERIGIVLDVVETSEHPDDQLKPISAILDQDPPLSAELIGTLSWAARYYQHPIGEVLESALPVLLRNGGELPEPGVAGVRLTDAGRATRADPRRRRGTRSSD
ncbi:MAG: primosomal protein N', partial [Dokdonella sp.]